MRRSAVAFLAVLTLAGCGTETVASPPATIAPAAPADVPSATEQPPPAVAEWDGAGPPPVTLHLDGDQVRLKPWAYCYGGTCADGFTEPPYEDVGRRDVVAFSFPEPGWTFEATFRDGEHEDCPRYVQVPVRATGDRTFEVTPVGPAGSWSVDLFGQAPEGGDVITTFAWTTASAGAFPDAATGSAGVLADHDGEVDSYGVEVYVEDLAAAPARASAEVTVTSASGRSVTLPVPRSKSCAGEGGLVFTAPDEVGRRATRLGPGPFEYDVALTLDGTTYHGTGTWPDDETEDIAPHVPLTWSPALPVYGAAAAPRAEASCVGPYLDDPQETWRLGLAPPTVARGETLTLRGHWFTRTCNDQGQDEPVVPLRDVRLTVTYADGRTTPLGPFTPAGRDAGFEAVLDVPPDAAAGAATVTVDGEPANPFAFEVPGG